MECSLVYLAARARALGLPLGTSEAGASLVEYALLVALIAVMCLTAVTALGDRAAANFSSISGSI